MLHGAALGCSGVTTLSQSHLRLKGKSGGYLSPHTVETNTFGAQGWIEGSLPAGSSRTENGPSGSRKYGPRPARLAKLNDNV